jgi:chitinase
MVGMDVTIYNTTGRLETVSADVDGHAVSREALISTPMTMAGSAVLDGVDPSKVVTAANRSKRTDPAGNGVIGVNKSGKTVVQWAALTGMPLSAPWLASPWSSMPMTSTFRL